MTITVETWSVASSFAQAPRAPTATPEIVDLISKDDEPPSDHS
jgi:hypothetical protein